MSQRRRVLVLVVAYNAEKTLERVLDRIPGDILDTEFEVLVIDDSSHDRTFELGLAYQQRSSLPLTVLRTPVNQGYGGNQKLGYRYAIEREFHAVVLLHGDGQYPPEMIPELVGPILQGRANAVFGSRMLDRFRALKGGMPLYKYIGNKILTVFQNAILGSNLSEFHSGYRAYSVKALANLPFERNTNDFHFDTEIIIQLMGHGMRIEEIPIPTYYGDEICHVNGLRYAKDVVASTLVSRLQTLGILYRRKFASNVAGSPYILKLGYPSSHTMAIAAVREGDRVLDLGCGAGWLAEVLRREKGCSVTGVDRVPASDLGVASRVDRYICHDLSTGTLPKELVGEQFDVILALDIIEHLNDPERFMDEIRETLGMCQPRLILTTPNIAFFLQRLALVFGVFNYGPRGILDLTHTRLFTFHTLLNLLEESGVEITEVKGVPAPFPLALGDRAAARALVSANHLAIRLMRRLSSYQVYVEGRFAPSVPALLRGTIDGSVEAQEQFARRTQARITVGGR